jgi:hypothetical protein
MAIPHTIHDRMISRLQRDYPQSQTRGFRRAMQKLKWDWEDWDDAEPLEVGEKKPNWQNFLDWARLGRTASFLTCGLLTKSACPLFALRSKILVE